MLQIRVFPCLLLKGEGLVKTVGFKNPTYIGDPINAVRIFNTREVDELLFLDIDATKENRSVNIELIKKISDECSMPLTVGGGIRTVQDIQLLMNSGVEKVAINTAAVKDKNIIRQAADKFGSQAIIGVVDVKKNIFGKYKVMTHSGSRSIDADPADWAFELEKQGAGEILVNSIDRDGTMKGYDTELIKRISSRVNVPVIACGGCGSIKDMASAVEEGGASAVTAGSFFVFHGPRRAVLINFPDRNELESVLVKS